MKNKAFTLAEVLITIGIVGVVAALTIPTLITNYRASVLSSQFHKAYSSLTQATSLISSKEYDSSADLGTVPVGELLEHYQNHMIKAVKCDLHQSDCPLGIFPQKYNGSFLSFVESNYKTYNGKKVSGMCMSDSALVLQNGMFIIVDNCSPIVIAVDTNGWQKPPNRFGHDFFMFQMVDNQLIPMGNAKTKEQFSQCSSSGSSGYNGLGCTDRAMKTKDYFKKLPK